MTLTTLLPWLFLLVGGTILYFGAEWLVRGSSGIALALGLSPLVVGLTVVAFGTSAPELVVSLIAAIGGNASIALGNVVGSNIANLGLILGITALIAPPKVEGGLFRREHPFLLLGVLLLPVFALNHVIGRAEGAILLALTLVYIAALLRKPPKEANAMAETISDSAETAGAVHGRSLGFLVLLTVAGLALLIAGGRLLVSGATDIARLFGMSDRIIGLTIVAIGTSIPELATSLIAAIRGHSSLAIGNVIGSNILNIFFILGIAAAIRPIPISLLAVSTDLLFLGAMTVLATFFLRSERRMHRGEGVVFVLSYVAFLLVILVQR